MPVHVDASLPVHPLTVDDVNAMVEADILGEDDRVELLDGVLVEMSPQSDPYMYAIRRLLALALPAVAAAGMELSPQCPLGVRSPISQPEPDLAVIPRTPRDAKPADALLVVEISKSSRRLDLGRKAELYAEADIPELLGPRRRAPRAGRAPRAATAATRACARSASTTRPRPRPSPSTSPCRSPSCSERFRAAWLRPGGC